MSPSIAQSALAAVQEKNLRCEACSRLRKYCTRVAREKRRAYLTEDYWGRPITGFGDPAARLVLIGLAPAAHGANRTGRIFTGDRSGDWLYRALFKAGFANQAESVRAEDGLKLRDAYVTCVVKCAPPDNKPTPAEISRCSGFLRGELAALPSAHVYVALGGIALSAAWPFLAPAGARRPKFGHGVSAPLADGRVLLCSYHPSQQNTFTGRLTEPMFDSIFAEARRRLTR
ncbi:MAG: uracil-DNA glycosylase [Bdellovibrionota bacterium]